MSLLICQLLKTNSLQVNKIILILSYHLTLIQAVRSSAPKFDKVEEIVNEITRPQFATSKTNCTQSWYFVVFHIKSAVLAAILAAILNFTRATCF